MQCTHTPRKSICTRVLTPCPQCASLPTPRSEAFLDRLAGEDKVLQELARRKSTTEEVGGSWGSCWKLGK